MIYKLVRQQFVLQKKKTVPIIYTRIHNQSQCEKNIEKSKVAEIKKYWFNKYINYNKNCNEFLEKKFPRIMHATRIFSSGTKNFAADALKYFSAVKKEIASGAESLTLEELYLSHTVPRNLTKIFPTLLIGVIPLAQYVIIPLAYKFPRQLLNSYYWTSQQKLDFMLLDYKERLKHNGPLFRCMKAQLPNIKDQTLKEKWNGIIVCLDSGTHPNVKDIIACSELFDGEPYSLSSLNRRHKKELLGIHDISSWKILKKMQLKERGMVIKNMDRAIQKEGGSIKLSDDQIHWALSFRGLNPVNMSIKSMRDWLDQWFIISNAVDEDTLSLLLHCPILLAYNHPNNRIIIDN